MWYQRSWYDQLMWRCSLKQCQAVDYTVTQKLQTTDKRFIRIVVDSFSGSRLIVAAINVIYITVASASRMIAHDYLSVSLSCSFPSSTTHSQWPLLRCIEQSEDVMRVIQFVWMRSRTWCRLNLFFVCLSYQPIIYQKFASVGSWPVIL